MANGGPAHLERGRAGGRGRGGRALDGRATEEESREGMEGRCRWCGQRGPEGATKAGALEDRWASDSKTAWEGQGYSK